jgi:hypothetical protein
MKNKAIKALGNISNCAQAIGLCTRIGSVSRHAVEGRYTPLLKGISADWQTLLNPADLSPNPNLTAIWDMSASTGSKDSQLRRP